LSIRDRFPERIDLYFEYSEIPPIVSGNIGLYALVLCINKLQVMSYSASKYNKFIYKSFNFLKLTDL
jgi:hypothetical protein